jgi:hypothetical protein
MNLYERNEKDQIVDLKQSGKSLFDSLKVRSFIDGTSSKITAVQNSLKNGTFVNIDTAKFDDCLGWLEEHSDNVKEYSKAVIIRENIDSCGESLNISDYFSIQGTAPKIRLTICFADNENKVLTNEKFMVIICNEIDQTLTKYFGDNNMVILR